MSWLQKTFPFLLGVQVGERTVGAQKTFIIVQYAQQQGRGIKARGVEENSGSIVQISNPPSWEWKHPRGTESQTVPSS